MKEKKFFLYLVVAMVATFGISVAIQSLLATWQPPDHAAPDNGDISLGEWEKDADDVYRLTGNVGIGVSDPAQRLSVGGNILLAGNYGVGFGNDLDSLRIDNANTANTLAFVTSGSERLRVNNLGNIGIGTTDPLTSRLRVVGGSGYLVGVQVSGSEVGVYGHGTTTGLYGRNSYGTWGRIADRSIDTNYSFRGNGEIETSQDICSGWTCMNGGYKLLASGSSIDEESRIRLYPDGSRAIYTQGGPRWMSVVNGGWDPDLNIKKIIFVARNSGDGYCASGDGVLNLTGGAGTFPTCRRCRYTDTTLSCEAAYTEDDWIALDINDVRKNTCPQNSGPSYAITGYYGIGTRCIYTVADTVESLQISQADWSDGTGTWEWEIWYR